MGCVDVLSPKSHSNTCIGAGQPTGIDRHARLPPFIVRRPSDKSTAAQLVQCMQDKPGLSRHGQNDWLLSAGVNHCRSKMLLLSFHRQHSHGCVKVSRKN